MHDWYSKEQFIIFIEKESMIAKDQFIVFIEKVQVSLDDNYCRV